jgi:methyl-accepting chemotaxis protein
MRWAFGMLVSIGAAAAIVVALLIARAISRPTVRLTRTMATLAAVDVTTFIPDQQRRDEIGAMAKAVEVFKQAMINSRRLSDEQALAAAAREARTRKVEALTAEFESAMGRLTDTLAKAAVRMEGNADGLLVMAEQTEERSATLAAAAEQTSANVQTVAHRRPNNWLPRSRQSAAGWLNLQRLLARRPRTPVPVMPRCRRWWRVRRRSAMW